MIAQRCLASVGIVLFLLESVSVAAEERIVLQEHLNHRWTHELVTYPFSADEGACARDSVRLAGAEGFVPVQLAGVEVWPGSASVKTARLAFVVGELPPLGTSIYTVTYGAGVPRAPVPTTDLKTRLEADHVEVLSTRFGIRLLLGERRYETPVPATEVPGPVLAMRLADGTWFGGSRLYGETAIAGFHACVTESGPVFVEVACCYSYADGNTNTVFVQLNAQADRAYFTTSVARECRNDGWDLTLNGLPSLALQFMPESANRQPGARMNGAWKERDIAAYAPGQVTRLVSWGDWFNEFTQTALHLAFLDQRGPTAKPVLGEPPQGPSAEAALSGEQQKRKPPDGRELEIRRLDAGLWVDPRYSDGGRAESDVPLMKAEDGAVFLRVSNKAGSRRWTVRELPSYRAKLGRVQRPSSVMQDPLEDLDVVKDLVLVWPESARKHPHLFLDAEEVQAGLERNPDIRKKLQNVGRLRRDLGSYVRFDTMRHAGAVICMYDAIVDSGLVSPQERRLFRAQMAYLAYRLASPANWSPERRYKTGNPNMTVAHIVNQGLAAAALRDHPMAETWSRKPANYMNRWLDRLDSAGHWFESSGYARVSLSKFVYFAIASQRAGLHDYLSDERFQRMVMYYERTLTPPDPQRVMRDGGCHPRVTPPYGRGGNGNSVGYGGLVAKATSELDPELSRLLQWSYAGTCFSTSLGERMEGYELLLVDRDLPTQRPDWRSELLPSVGALFRSGVGSAEENYLLLVSKYARNPDGEIWPSEVGALTLWFEHGKPLTRVFPAGSEYPNLHGLLLNRVMLASSYEHGKTTPAGYTGTEEMTGFATLPRLDYIGERYRWRGAWSFFPAPPAGVPAFPQVERQGRLVPAGVTWQRQAAYVRAAEPGGKNYLVLRDTISGGQPTQWQFWTLSRGISALDGGVAKKSLDEELDDMLAGAGEEKSLLGGIKGVGEPKIPMPTELTGSRFLAKGQFGLDLDYFVASPSGTPRHTMRHTYHAPQSGVVKGFACAQDLFHLQLPGDGVYFVALVPRERDEPVPRFTTIGEGTVIKVVGAFGTDYTFLADRRQTVQADEVVFSGTAACVQDRDGGMVLVLGGEGGVSYRGYGLASNAGAELQVGTDVLTLRLAGTQGGTLTVTAPGGWAGEAADGVTFTAQPGGYRLTMVPGVVEARLLRNP